MSNKVTLALFTQHFLQYR